MATKTVYLTGTVNWAHHLFTPDEYQGKKTYKCDFYPDKDSLAKFKESGSKLHRKVNDDGQVFIRPSTPTEKLFPKTGKVQEFTVDVRDKEGQPWPEGVAIGNGSKVTIKLEVYDTSFDGNPIKGTRLKAVRVDELVEYNKPEETVYSSDNDDDPLPF